MLFDVLRFQDIACLWSQDINREAFEHGAWQKDTVEWKSDHAATYSYLMIELTNSKQTKTK